MFQRVLRLIESLTGVQLRHITQEQLIEFYGEILSPKEESRVLAHGRRCPECQKLLDRAPYLEAIDRKMALEMRADVGEEIAPEQIRAASQIHLDGLTLSAYAGGFLNQRLVPRVEEHIAECPGCSRDLETIQWINSNGDPLEPPVGVPANWRPPAQS